MTSDILSIILVLGGILVVLLTMWRPVLGLALYLLIYPMVPAEESISFLKVAILGLTILILFIWVIQKSIKRERLFSKPEYLYLYLFFLFLCISPIIGLYGDFSLTDWARDIAPLLNLLLLPVLVDFIGKKRNQWIIYLIFIPIGLGILRDTLYLFTLYGFTAPDFVLDFMYGLPLISLHPSIGVGLGLIMFIYGASHKRYWLILAGVGMLEVFLTPGRTIWITTITMILLLTLFSVRQRLIMLVVVLALATTLGWFTFYGPTSSSYKEIQDTRFQLLMNYQSDLSFLNRQDEMQQTFALFQSSPIVGVGFGYQYDFFRSYVKEIGRAGQLTTNFTHNDIMFIASKGGIIGLILFGLMLFRLAQRLYRIGIKNSLPVQSAWARFGFVAIINSLIVGLSTPVFQARSSMFILMILIAMGLGFCREPQTRQAEAACVNKIAVTTI